jgi:S-DNA-T family DNA segregation ATPase FtsK/SpoIIIE
MEAPGAGDSAANSHLSSEDELMPQALEILQNSNKPSASLLQRRLRIGYNRAARMVDFLVAEGYLEKGDTSLEEED